MKRITLLTILVALICFTVNVNADSYVATEGDSKFNTLETEYNKGIQKTYINGSGTVTLYGYSDCDTSGCNYKYSNTSSDFKEVLKQSVICTGGEKYIIYQMSGGADGYKSDNTAKYSGEAYWSEDFAITCTGTSSSSTITLNNTTSDSTSDTTSGGTSSSGTSSSGSTSGSSSSDSQYESSSTTNPSETGVETYYIVLGIIGIITYSLMLIIKKQNLFKKV